MCKGKGVYVGRMGEWCIGCVGEGEGPEGSVCVGRKGEWCIGCVGEGEGPEGSVSGEDGGMVCVCLVNLGQPTLLCLAGLADANRRFCSVCPSLSHCLPSIQMSRPLQVKPAGTDARSGTTQMRCGKPTAVVY